MSSGCTRAALLVHPSPSTRLRALCRALASKGPSRGLGDPEGGIKQVDRFSGSKAGRPLSGVVGDDLSIMSSEVSGALPHDQSRPRCQRWERPARSDTCPCRGCQTPLATRRCWAPDHSPIATCRGSKQAMLAYRYSTTIRTGCSVPQYEPRLKGYNARSAPGRKAYHARGPLGVYAGARHHDIGQLCSG